MDISIPILQKAIFSSFTVQERENKIIILIIDSNKTSMQAQPQKAALQLPETLTGGYTDKKMSDLEDNLAIFINNIVLFCKEIQSKSFDQQTTIAFKEKLKEQFNVMLFEEKIEKFSDIIKVDKVDGEIQGYEKKLYDLEVILRQLIELKNNASSESKYIGYENEANSYISALQFLINQQNIQTALENFDVLHNQKTSEEVKEGTSEIDIPSDHFFKERIRTKIDYQPKVFQSVRPDKHQVYISQVAKAYHQITPFKLKNISLSIADGPQINRNNFFEEGIDESKAILHYCIPNTKKIAFYMLVDICKTVTIGKQLYRDRDLSNDWTFSSSTKSIITSSGKIFAINCRTTKQKIDPYLYQITDSKASNRGPLPASRRDASLLYMNGYIYLIGGKGDGEKCSKKNYKYSIKEKKWIQISESNVPLRKATVCSLNNRYICKIGGLNQFDYINKIIQIYDYVSDKWALVRASPRNILEEIQILQDSQAVQITEDQIYIFGGKNSNKFDSDSGFILVINEIREKKKGAPKVTGQFWNVSIGKRNILSFSGNFSAVTPIVHYNCIYSLRTDVTDALSI